MIGISSNGTCSWASASAWPLLRPALVLSSLVVHRGTCSCGRSGTRDPPPHRRGCVGSPCAHESWATGVRVHDR
ncbi:hypothetical protein QJS66_10210 [Kocuria rhizophila]|nr:hypothetical protein QJS66_10210 [Kocuria rhizophila]